VVEENADRANSRKPLSRKMIALIFAGIGILASGAVKNAGDWAWTHFTGEDRAKLSVLDVRVDGETATSPNYNADALQRIGANHEFPRVELVLRNTGGKTGSVSALDMKVKRVWTLRDPHGPVKPTRGSKVPKTPDFGAYKGADVRVDSSGFVVPESVPQTLDISSKASKPVRLAFRNIEEPSTKEYIVQMEVVVEYDGSERMVIPNLFFSSAAIGSYYPAYERKLIVDRGDPYDPKLVAANAEVIREVRALKGRKSPRVQFLEAEFRARGLE
jgi:hypothetical protein